MEGTSSKQMLQVINASLVGMALVPTLGPAREDAGASVDPVLLEGFASGTLVQITSCQYAMLKYPA
jgi:hypothetical protein